MSPAACARAGPALSAGCEMLGLMDTPLTDEGAAPPTRLRSFSPIFPVRDLGHALAHYASLGFEVTPYANGDFYGFADRDEVSLHLALEAGHDHDGEHDHEHVGSAYLYVADADALYDEWARPGVGGLHRPHDADRGDGGCRRDEGSGRDARVPGPQGARQLAGTRCARRGARIRSEGWKLLLSRTGDGRAATPAAPTGGRRTGGKP